MIHDDVIICHMRTIVDLPEEQLSSLARICSRDGISRAEAIRRAVTLYAKREQSTERAVSAAFGLWRGRHPDALAYESDLRSEWDPTSP
jgi:hypothetical protein